jgi:RHS repeat-associated protein
LSQVSGEHNYHYNTDGTLGWVDLADGRRITYQYDHRGRRIARSVDGVRTHGWLYGQGLMPLGEYDTSGSLRTVYFYAAGATPITMIRSDTTYHIINDHLGSPRLVVDNTGTVVKQLDYDSFGNVISDTNPAFDLVFGFASGLADPDHELIRFGARDYQPSSGRWTARDPILFVGGLNLYEYVGNDPLNLVDREGFGELKSETEDMVDEECTGPYGYKVPAPLPDKELSFKYSDDIAVPGIGTTGVGACKPPPPLSDKLLSFDYSIELKNAGLSHTGLEG